MKKTVAIAALLSGVVLVACKPHKEEQAPVAPVVVPSVVATSAVAPAASEVVSGVSSSSVGEAPKASEGTSSK